MEQFSSGLGFGENSIDEQSRSLDESIVAEAPDRVVILDHTGAIIEATESFSDLLGSTRHGLTGIRFIELLDPESQAAFAILWELRRLGRPDITRFRLRLANAAENRTDIYVRSQYFVLRDGECCVIHILSANRTYEEAPASLAPSEGNVSQRVSAHQHVEVIQRVSQAITSSRQLPELYETIRLAVSQAFPVDAIVIGRLDPDDGRLRTVYAAEGGTPYDLVDEMLAEPFRDALRTGEPFIVNRIPEDMFSDGARFDSRSRKVQALLGAPLLLNGDVTGIIVAQSYEQDVYTDLDATLMGAIARSVAVAIERSQVIDDLTRRLHRERRLRQMIDRIGDRLNPEEILDASIEAIFEFIPNAITLLALQDDNHQDLVVQRVISRDLGLTPQDLPQPGDLPVEDSLVRTTFERAQQIYIGDIRGHEFSGLQRVASLGGVSVVATPIPGQDRPAGSIFVTRSEPYAFPDHDLALLRTVANLIGIWLRDARVYDESKQRAQDLQDVQHISRIVASSLDVAQTLAELVSLVPRMLDADGCSVRLLEDGDMVLAAGAGEVSLTFAERIPLRETESANMPDDLQPVFKRDLRTDPATRKNVKRKGIKARGWAAAPLINEHGQVFGAISVHTASPRDWSERDRTLLTTLAASASQAYRN
ncbi:MAG: GAF domain-containing protein, partial [Chloroflexota bacterium]